MTVTDMTTIERLARQTAARTGMIIVIIGTPADHSTQMAVTVPEALRVVTREAGDRPCVIASAMTTHYRRD